LLPPKQYPLFQKALAIPKSNLVEDIQAVQSQIATVVQQRAGVKRRVIYRLQPRSKQWQKRWVLHPSANEDRTYLQQDTQEKDEGGLFDACWYPKWCTRDLIVHTSRADQNQA
jgi:hypothetical protein